MGLFDFFKKSKSFEEKDFAMYSSVILMQNVGVSDIEKCISDYKDIYDDEYQFEIQSINGVAEWNVVKIPESMKGDFWTYTNLIIWLSQASEDVIGYAWNEGNSICVMPNEEDKLGEAVKFKHNKSMFKFNVPENTMTHLSESKDASTPEQYIEKKYNLNVENIK